MISSSIPLDTRSKLLRQLAIDALEGGERGHVGSTMSLIEIMRVLYDSVVVHSPVQPDLPDRDRVILSKGHGCIALYAILADHGYFSRDELRYFCRFGSALGGHPERGHLPGVEASTGSLGHGLAIGVGMAIAARIRARKNRVFVVLGDGELNEGSVWESAIAASHHRLSNLVVIVDCNGLQSFGPTESVWTMEPLTGKWESFGFDVREADGHSVEDLGAILLEWESIDKPKVLLARTIKGKGIEFAENNLAWHHKSRISSEDVIRMREAVRNA